jgi:hypothetical protein
MVKKLGPLPSNTRRETGSPKREFVLHSLLNIGLHILNPKQTKCYTFPATRYANNKMDTILFCLQDERAELYIIKMGAVNEYVCIYLFIAI